MYTARGPVEARTHLPTERFVVDVMVFLVYENIDAFLLREVLQLRDLFGGVVLKRGGLQPRCRHGALKMRRRGLRSSRGRAFGIDGCFY